MANLAEDVDEIKPDWTIDADLDEDIDYLTVEDEIVKITANFPAQLDAQTRVLGDSKIRVERGAGGTTPATHSDGTALTQLIPPAAASPDGGAIPDPATGNVGDVPTVNAGQDGYDLGPRSPVYLGADDPADVYSVSPGEVWLDTSLSATNVQAKVRNTANDGWEPLPLVVAVGGVFTAGLFFAADGTLTLARAGGNETITVDPDGTIVLGAELGTLTVAPDGTTTVIGGGATLTMAPDGTLSYVGTGTLTLAPDGSLTWDAAVKLLGLPSADPEVAGQLYTDGAISAGTPQALMVSGGPA